MEQEQYKTEIENTEVKKHSAQTLAVPIAIVVAGLSIAVAIYWGGKGSAGGNVTAPVQKNPSEVSVDPVTPADHLLGDPNAKVVIVEYSDTECPFCKMFHPTLKRIMSDAGTSGNVAWVYRHFPLPIHSRSPHEAEAVECANKIGGNAKFWEYLDKVFDITPANNQLDPAELPRIAKTVGLDVTKFNACLGSGEMKSVIDNDIASGTRAGLQGTPYSVILVNKKVVGFISGAQPYETVKAQILDALK